MKYVKIAALVVGLLIVVLGISGWLYYRSLEIKPQYSLALLVDAAKRDDRAEIDSLVDINAVVDDFVPQVMDKAVDLYGRGQPPDVIAKARRVAEPLMPAVKERARAELPRVIRERTQKFGSVPFAAMVLGADRYLDIRVSGDIADVKSKIPDHPLELRMKRSGDRWQIVSIRDDQLATTIAQTIGQEVMAIASKGLESSALNIGVGNLADLIRQAQELVK